MRRELPAADQNEPPIDWLAQFDSESDAGADGRDASGPDADLSMFPPEADSERRDARPDEPTLFRVQPAPPPTGPQERFGSYVHLESPAERLAVLMPGVGQAIKTPSHRRRVVLAAIAVILAISSAALAGSLAVRRWGRVYHPPPTNPPSAEVNAAPAQRWIGPFGGSIASSDELAPTTGPVPSPIVAPSPKPTPIPTLAVAQPPATRPTPTAAPLRDQINLAAARDRTPAPSPSTAAIAPPVVTTSSDRPLGGASRQVNLATSPTPTATPTPAATTTPTLTPTPTPTAPPRPAPAARDDARPPATAAPPSVSPEAADTAAVQGVIDRYRHAFDTLSVDDVASFWPSVNVRSLARAFDQLASQQLTFEGCTIELRGIQADATCRGRARYVPKVGSRTPHVENRHWTFLLLRSGQGWTITRVDVK